MKPRAAEDLVNSLKALLVSDDKGDCDFTIRSEDENTGWTEEFKVHSILLKERGHFLNTIVSSNFKEKKEQVLSLPFDSKTVQVLVDFLYGQDLQEDIEPSTLRSVIVAAQTYDMKNLLKAALDLLPAHLASKNPDEIYEELAHFKIKNCELGVSVCRFILERKFWNSIIYGNKFSAWKQLTVVGEEITNVKIEESIPLHAFGFSVGNGSEVEIEIYNDEEIIQTHQYQEPRDDNKLEDEVIVAFKEAIKLPVGSKLKLLARGRGTLATYTSTPISSRSQTNPSNCMYCVNAISCYYCGRSDPSTTYRKTLYNCYKNSKESLSTTPVSFDNPTTGWIQTIYF